jgi:hypothetical protein
MMIIRLPFVLVNLSCGVDANLSHELGTVLSIWHLTYFLVKLSITSGKVGIFCRCTGTQVTILSLHKLYIHWDLHKWEGVNINT